MSLIPFVGSPASHPAGSVGSHLASRAAPSRSPGPDGTAVRRLVALVLAMACLRPLSLPAEEDDARDEAPEVLAPVIVSATRLEEEQAVTASSVTVVDAVRIRERGHDEAQEVLRTVPGVHVVRIGGRGGQTTLFVRGGESDHTLVLLDGFQINRDGGFFDWNKALTNGLERVEIVRGAGSAPHGSDALAGTVNLVLRRGEGDPTAFASFEAGTFSTFRERLDFQGQIDKFRWSASASNLDQNDARFDHSDLDQQSFIGRFDFDFSQETTVKLDVFQAYDRAEINSAFVPPLFGPEDPNSDREEDVLLTAMEARHRVAKGCELRLALSRYRQDPQFVDAPDPAEPFDDFRQHTTIVRDTIDLGAALDLVDASWIQLQTLVGFEFEKESVHDTSAFLSFDTFPPAVVHAEAREHRENRGVYLSNVVRLWKRVTLELSGRFDNNTEFDENRTARAAGSYLHAATDTRLHASWGKGIKEPTFFETFDSQFGNPALTPETGRTYDVGIEQKLWDDRITLDLTYFNSRLDNLIQFRVLSPFPFTADFINAGKAKNDGIEVSWSISPIEELTLEGSFTHLNTEAVKSNDPGNVSFTQGEDLLRRPDETVWAGLTGRPCKGLALSLSWHHVGEREDARFDLFPATREQIDPYDKFDFAGEYRFDFGLRLFGVLENLTGQDYEEALGFPGEEANFLGGIGYDVSF